MTINLDNQDPEIPLDVGDRDSRQLPRARVAVNKLLRFWRPTTRSPCFRSVYVRTRERLPPPRTQRGPPGVLAGLVALGGVFGVHQPDGTGFAAQAISSPGRASGSDQPTSGPVGQPTGQPAHGGAVSGLAEGFEFCPGFTEGEAEFVEDARDRRWPVRGIADAVLGDHDVAGDVGRGVEDTHSGVWDQRLPSHQARPIGDLIAQVCPSAQGRGQRARSPEWRSTRSPCGRTLRRRCASIQDGLATRTDPTAHRYVGTVRQGPSGCREFHGPWFRHTFSQCCAVRLPNDPTGGGA